MSEVETLAKREKLVHAAAFFRSCLPALHASELYWLLSHLDYEIFMETGRLVTGLVYRASPEGPEPIAPAHELFGIWEAPVADFDSKLFTPRELKVMSRIAVDRAEGQPASDNQRLPHSPWRITRAITPGEKIDPMLALRNPGALTRDEVEERNTEAEEIRRAWKPE